MKLDLHIHTTAYSPCSVMSPDQLMEAARREGLEGVCITEHNFLWSQGEADDLREKYGLAVFRGAEITTTGGDILVFGCEALPEGMLTPAELKTAVDAQGGICIAAHPFRGFLIFGFGKLELDVEGALDNPTFSQVHGLETCNGMVTEQENEMAGKVADALNLLKVGGSDAHSPKAVGTCVTTFWDVIRNESDLVNALKAKRFSLERWKS